MAPMTNTLIVNGKRHGQVFVPHGQVHYLKQYVPMTCLYHWFCLHRWVFLLFPLVRSYGPVYTYDHHMLDTKFHMLLGWVIYLQSLGPTVWQRQVNLYNYTLTSWTHREIYRNNFFFNYLLVIFILSYYLWFIPNQY